MAIKYDTLLFGNGLSIKVLNEANAKMQIEQYESFIANFLRLQKEDLMKINFYKILDSNINSRFYLTQDDIAKVELFLIHNLKAIEMNGYEVFIGLRIFSTDPSLMKDVSLYYYSLYNYWYNLNMPKFSSKEFKEIIASYVAKVNAHGFNNIFTTNFDKYFDDCLTIKHIHGCFVENYLDVQEMHVEYYVKKGFLDGNHYYKIAVGTNGIEKLNGLNQIRLLNYTGYDFSFLFDESLNVGNLLIFGMRFADSMIVPKELKEKYSLADIDFVEYVDGHIMQRLDVLFESNRLKSVTIAYYSLADKERYEKVFSKRKINQVINYIDCKKVF